MSMNRHEPYEELISASLTEELSTAERDWLDAHLDVCAQCRDTLAAFAGQRRIMAGLRHVAPPRDLGARVRTGIERGRFRSTPWWRPPAVMFAGIGGSLAAVAGALLALVLLNGSPAGPEVGQASPSPTATLAEASEAPQQTLPPVATPTPNASPGESAPPTAEASPPPNPVVEAPKPDVILTATGPVEELSLAVVEAATESPLPVEAPVDDGDEPKAPTGPPIVAELSPDGQWLAFITEFGTGGAAMTDVWATRLAEGPEPIDPEASPPIDSTASVGETVHLGTSRAGSPFLERLAWSSDGAYLAYTIMDPDPGEEADEVNTDVWLFATAEAEMRQLTDTGTAYAASFVPNDEEDPAPRLWISTADAEPVSRLHEVGDDGDTIDPAEEPIAEAEGVFQPLLSPNGELAIFWRGQMATDLDRGWIFAEDGAPQLAEHHQRDAAFTFENERPVFSDLPTRGSLIESASIAWGLDGDAYAVWDTTLVGEQELTDEEPYPDAARVYFGHATDGRGLTRTHAIDRGDVAEDMVVVDVEVAPTGGHLLITARQRPGGIGDTPRAVLLLITRNVGDVADEVDVLQVAEDGWAGPAVFQAEPEFDSSQAP